MYSAFDWISLIFVYTPLHLVIYFSRGLLFNTVSHIKQGESTFLRGPPPFCNGTIFFLEIALVTLITWDTIY